MKWLWLEKPTLSAHRDRERLGVRENSDADVLSGGGQPHHAGENRSVVQQMPVAGDGQLARALGEADHLMVIDDFVVDFLESVPPVVQLPGGDLR